jgi:apolipoprotein N-acyltransferase
VVLPETVAFVHGEQGAQWEQTLRRWASANSTTFVAGLFDEDQTRNRLLVVDPRGDVVDEYDKRHPLRGGEPAQPSRQPPLEVDGPLPVSACYDLDFSDYRRAVATHGGVLAAPSNDWREFADLHDGLAVWAPVMTGVPLVRSTSHGTAAVFDAAGRRIASTTSFDGAVVLLADVPVE